jgi:hypothetical protein
MELWPYRQDDLGFVIADSRMKRVNTQVSHSIFTQKFRTTGDTYDGIVEVPAFSHSDNHAGLELADAICSALLFPLAVHTCCAGHITSLYVRLGYQRVKDRYGRDLSRMQHRYQEASGQWRGGIVLSDPIGGKNGGALFT